MKGLSTFHSRPCTLSKQLISLPERLASVHSMLHGCTGGAEPGPEDFDQITTLHIACNWLIY